MNLNANTDYDFAIFRALHESLLSDDDKKEILGIIELKRSRAKKKFRKKL